MDYNDDWFRFADRVGWRKDGDWLDYDNLIFGLHAPTGEFPCWVGFGRWPLMRGFRVVSSLAQRLVECKR